jgi:hypothetical protein
VKRRFGRNLPRFYFVIADIKKAYDTIIKEKIFGQVKQLIGCVNLEKLLHRPYEERRLRRDRIQTKYLAGLQHGDYYKFEQFATKQALHRTTNAIFVDKVGFVFLFAFLLISRVARKICTGQKVRLTSGTESPFTRRSSQGGQRLVFAHTGHCSR